MAVSGVDQLLDLVSPVYREAGRSQLFQVHRPDDGHGVPGEILQLDGQVVLKSNSDLESGSPTYLASFRS